MFLLQLQLSFRPLLALYLLVLINTASIAHSIVFASIVLVSILIFSLRVFANSIGAFCCSSRYPDLSKTNNKCVCVWLHFPTISLSLREAEKRSDSLLLPFSFLWVLKQKHFSLNMCMYVGVDLCTCVLRVGMKGDWGLWLVSKNQI